jgi:hypothetical protein
MMLITRLSRPNISTPRTFHRRRGLHATPHFGACLPACSLGTTLLQARPRHWELRQLIPHTTPHYPASPMRGITHQAYPANSRCPTLSSADLPIGSQEPQSVTERRAYISTAGSAALDCLLPPPFLLSIDRSRSRPCEASSSILSRVPCCVCNLL